MPTDACCVVRTGRRARVAESAGKMALHLDTVAREYSMRLRKHAYEDQQARRRQKLRLGQEMTESQRVQVDHEASLDIQTTRVSRLARAENELKGLSRRSRWEAMSLRALQLDLTEMLVTTFERPRTRVASLQDMSSNERWRLLSLSKPRASGRST